MAVSRAGTVSPRTPRRGGLKAGNDGASWLSSSPSGGVRRSAAVDAAVEAPARLRKGKRDEEPVVRLADKLGKDRSSDVLAVKLHYTSMSRKALDRNGMRYRPIDPKGAAYIRTPHKLDPEATPPPEPPTDSVALPSPPVPPRVIPTPPLPADALPGVHAHASLLGNGALADIPPAPPGGGAEGVCGGGSRPAADLRGNRFLAGRRRGAQAEDGRVLITGQAGAAAEAAGSYRGVEAGRSITATAPRQGVGVTGETVVVVEAAVSPQGTWGDHREGAEAGRSITVTAPMPVAGRRFALQKPRAASPAAGAKRRQQTRKRTAGASTEPAPTPAKGKPTGTGTRARSSTAPPTKRSPTPRGGANVRPDSSGGRAPGAGKHADRGIRAPEPAVGPCRATNRRAERSTTAPVVKRNHTAPGWPVTSRASSGGIGASWRTDADDRNENGRSVRSTTAPVVQRNHTSPMRSAEMHERAGHESSRGGGASWRKDANDRDENRRSERSTTAAVVQRNHTAPGWSVTSREMHESESVTSREMHESESSTRGLGRNENRRSERSTTAPLVNRNNVSTVPGLTVGTRSENRAERSTTAPVVQRNHTAPGGSVTPREMHEGASSRGIGRNGGNESGRSKRSTTAPVVKRNHLTTTGRSAPPRDMYEGASFIDASTSESAGSSRENRRSKRSNTAPVVKRNHTAKGAYERSRNGSGDASASGNADEEGDCSSRNESVVAPGASTPPLRRRNVEVYPRSRYTEGSLSANIASVARVVHKTERVTSTRGTRDPIFARLSQGKSCYQTPPKQPHETRGNPGPAKSPSPRILRRSLSDSFRSPKAPAFTATSSPDTPQRKRWVSPGTSHERRDNLAPAKSASPRVLRRSLSDSFRSPKTPGKRWVSHLPKSAATSVSQRQRGGVDLQQWKRDGRGPVARNPFAWIDEHPEGQGPQAGQAPRGEAFDAFRERHKCPGGRHTYAATVAKGVFCLHCYRFFADEQMYACGNFYCGGLACAECASAHVRAAEKEAKAAEANTGTAPHCVSNEGHLLAKSCYRHTPCAGCKQYQTIDEPVYLCSRAGCGTALCGPCKASNARHPDPYPRSPPKRRCAPDDHHYLEIAHRHEPCNHCGLLQGPTLPFFACARAACAVRICASCRHQVENPEGYSEQNSGSEDSSEKGASKANGVGLKDTFACLQRVLRADSISTRGKESSEEHNPSDDLSQRDTARELKFRREQTDNAAFIGSQTQPQLRLSRTLPSFTKPRNLPLRDPASTQQTPPRVRTLPTTVPPLIPVLSAHNLHKLPTPTPQQADDAGNTATLQSTYTGITSFVFPRPCDVPDGPASPIGYAPASPTDNHCASPTDNHCDNHPASPTDNHPASPTGDSPGNRHVPLTDNNRTSPTGDDSASPAGNPPALSVGDLRATATSQAKRDDEEPVPAPRPTQQPHTRKRENPTEAPGVSSFIRQLRTTTSPERHRSGINDLSRVLGASRPSDEGSTTRSSPGVNGTDTVLGSPGKASSAQEDLGSTVGNDKDHGPRVHALQATESSWAFGSTRHREAEEKPGHHALPSSPMFQSSAISGLSRVLGARREPSEAGSPQTRSTALQLPEVESSFASNAHARKSPGGVSRNGEDDEQALRHNNSSRSRSSSQCSGADETSRHMSGTQRSAAISSLSRVMGAAYSNDHRQDAPHVSRTSSNASGADKAAAHLGSSQKANNSPSRSESNVDGVLGSHVIDDLLGSSQRMGTARAPPERQASGSDYSRVSPARHDCPSVAGSSSLPPRPDSLFSDTRSASRVQGAVAFLSEHSSPKKASSSPGIGEEAASCCDEDFPASVLGRTGRSETNEKRGHQADLPQRSTAMSDLSRVLGEHRNEPSPPHRQGIPLSPRTSSNASRVHGEASLSLAEEAHLLSSPKETSSLRGLESTLGHREDLLARTFGSSLNLESTRRSAVLDGTCSGQPELHSSGISDLSRVLGLSGSRREPRKEPSAESDPPRDPASTARGAADAVGTLLARMSAAGSSRAFGETTRSTFVASSPNSSWRRVRDPDGAAAPEAPAPTSPEGEACDDDVQYIVSPSNTPLLEGGEDSGQHLVSSSDSADAAGGAGCPGTDDEAGGRLPCNLLSYPLGFDREEAASDTPTFSSLGSSLSRSTPRVTRHAQGATAVARPAEFGPRLSASKTGEIEPNRPPADANGAAGGARGVNRGCEPHGSNDRVSFAFPDPKSSERLASGCDDRVLPTFPDSISSERPAGVNRAAEPHGSNDRVSSAFPDPKSSERLASGCEPHDRVLPTFPDSKSSERPAGVNRAAEPHGSNDRVSSAFSDPKSSRRSTAAMQRHASGRETRDSIDPASTAASSVKEAIDRCFIPGSQAPDLAPGRAPPSFAKTPPIRSLAPPNPGGGAQHSPPPIAPDTAAKPPPRGSPSTPNASAEVRLADARQPAFAAKKPRTPLPAADAAAQPSPAGGPPAAKPVPTADHAASTAPTHHSPRTSAASDPDIHRSPTSPASQSGRHFSTVFRENLSPGAAPFAGFQTRLAQLEAGGDGDGEKKLGGTMTEAAFYSGVLRRRSLPPPPLIAKTMREVGGSVGESIAGDVDDDFTDGGQQQQQHQPEHETRSEAGAETPPPGSPTTRGDQGRTNSQATTLSRRVSTPPLPQDTRRYSVASALEDLFGRGAQQQPPPPGPGGENPAADAFPSISQTARHVVVGRPGGGFDALFRPRARLPRRKQSASPERRRTPTRETTARNAEPTEKHASPVTPRRGNRSRSAVSPAEVCPPPSSDGSMHAAEFPELGGSLASARKQRGSQAAAPHRHLFSAGLAAAAENAGYICSFCTGARTRAVYACAVEGCFDAVCLGCLQREAAVDGNCLLGRHAYEPAASRTAPCCSCGAVGGGAGAGGMYLCTAAGCGCTVCGNCRGGSSLLPFGGGAESAPRRSAARVCKDRDLNTFSIAGTPSSGGATGLRAGRRGLVAASQSPVRSRDFAGGARGFRRVSSTSAGAPERRATSSPAGSSRQSDGGPTNSCTYGYNHNPHTPTSLPTAARRGAAAGVSRVANPRQPRATSKYTPPGVSRSARLRHTACLRPESRLNAFSPFPTPAGLSAKPGSAGNGGGVVTTPPPSFLVIPDAQAAAPWRSMQPAADPMMEGIFAAGAKGGDDDEDGADAGSCSTDASRPQSAARRRRRGSVFDIGYGVKAADLAPGAAVERDPDHWKWGDQDGGPGGTGVVTGVNLETGWVKVKWEATQRVNSYRYGFAGQYDVAPVVKPGANSLQTPPEGGGLKALRVDTGSNPNPRETPLPGSGSPKGTRRAAVSTTNPTTAGALANVARLAPAAAQQKHPAPALGPGEKPPGRRRRRSVSPVGSSSSSSPKASSVLKDRETVVQLLGVGVDARVLIPCHQPFSLSSQDTGVKGVRDYIKTAGVFLWNGEAVDMRKSPSDYNMESALDRSQHEVLSTMEVLQFVPSECARAADLPNAVKPSDAMLAKPARPRVIWRKTGAAEPASPLDLEEYLSRAEKTGNLEMSTPMSPPAY
ncbi:hypothetical protein DIPPA_20152 [Diplonema papillatum]|nr:hypothetical protein DIPPA_20152 [Diplonema papillatum]